MPDDNRLVPCPSCGHKNVPYVDRCILCDFVLPRYSNQPPTRPMNQSRLLQDDRAPRDNKRLRPLPESDLLVDKHKNKRNLTSQVYQCPECGASYRDDSRVCSHCGTQLDTTPLEDNSSYDNDMDDLTFFDDNQPTDTQSVYDVDLARDHPTELPAIRISQGLDEPVENIPSGCFKFTAWMILRLDVEDFDTPIVVRPLEDKPLLIGRRHESLSVQPHIDLSPYLSDRHGVSRRHALLRLRGTRLELQDLNSTNGTSINGVRFSPRESHQLRHHDLIRIGQVKIYVSFIQQVRSAKFGYTEELS